VNSLPVISRRTLFTCLLAFGTLSSLAAAPSRAQEDGSNWYRLVTTPAVSGYEQQLVEEIRSQLGSLAAKTDNMGNLLVTIGSGSPHRLIVTPIDEPGYVVSAITPDGYLRVQRLPQAAPNSVFDLLHAAQPITIITRKGQKVSGVVAGLSVHLQPARLNGPKMAHPDEMYVDIGAANAEEVHAAGVDLLNPISLNRQVHSLANSEVTAPAIGDRFGCVALLDFLKALHRNKAQVSGTLTVAFITEQWVGGRGLDRILNEVTADEMVYVGRLAIPRANPNAAPSTAVPLPTAFKPGDGMLLGVSDESAPLGDYATELKTAADAAGVKIHAELAAVPRIGGYASQTSFPKKFAYLGVPILFPVTPAETLSLSDVGSITHFLYQYLVGTKSVTGEKGGIIGGPIFDAPILQNLTETYGASGHETAVREAIAKFLPKDAKTETDASGDLILRLGAAAGGSAKKIVFVAHMDEIGYQVHSIEPDGRLLVDVLGGGYTEYFLGHAVLVHKADGLKQAGVIELPAGWDKPGFEWPHGPRTMDDAVHVYLGTNSAEETQKLGIKVGDWITIPKKYHPLYGTRANARSFDDRVGCTALLQAVNSLGLNLPGRDVTFVWSTEEEVGLKGAAAVAEKMAKDGHPADFVFAIDTFVSSDSPLESKRFADAEIGKGFVVRAIDNSNIAPREYVDRVVQLAHDNNIPVQFGVTGGGNDGAVFTRYGAVDIPLSWPLRYAHSAAEVIDTRDVDALSKIVAVLAKNW
jgi:putative aminopeptidase FrvX